MVETVSQRLKQSIRAVVRDFGGIQESDFVRQIAYPLLKSRGGGNLPALSAPAGSGDAARIHAAVEQLCPELTSAADVGRRVMTAALALAAARDARCAPGDVSEKIATRVGRHVRQTGGPVDADMVACIALEVQPTSIRPMSKDQFVGSQTGAYDQQWAAHGAGAWLEWPPASMGLGSNSRPPLIGDGDDPDLTRGTARPVYARYRAYFKQTGATRRRRCQHRRCAPGRTPPADALPSRTIRQICSGLTLAHAEHRLFLRSLEIGLGEEPMAREGQWAAFSEPDRDLPDSENDVALIEHVGGHLSAWLASPSGKRLQYMNPTLSKDWPIFRRAALLKAHDELVRWEREHDHAMGSCGAAAIASIAIVAGIPFRGAELMAEQVRTCASVERVPRTDQSRDFMYQARFTLTMDLLADQLSLARAIVEDQPQWRGEYQQWAKQIGADRLLTVDEVEEWRAEVRDD